MDYPFEISAKFNENMKAFELILQIGGLRDKQEVEVVAAALAKFMTAEGGEVKRVGFDA